MRLQADGIAFIILDRAKASESMQRYIRDELPVHVIAEESSRVLYRIGE
jgi:hypothetical protein